MFAVPRSIGPLGLSLLVLLMGQTCGAQRTKPKPTEVSSGKVNTGDQRLDALAVLRESIDWRGPAALLKYPAAQAELKLTDEQKKRLRDPLAKLNMHVSVVRNSSSADSRGKASTLPKELAFETIEKSIADILKPAQRKRLTELSFQVQGALAIVRPDVQDLLELDDEQREAVARIVEQAREAVSKSRSERNHLVNEFIKSKNNRVEPEEIQDFLKVSQPKFDTLRIEAEQTRKRAVVAIGKVLSKEQRAAFQRMLGRPFEITRLLEVSPISPAVPKPSKSGPPEHSKSPEARRAARG